MANLTRLAGQFGGNLAVEQRRSCAQKVAQNSFCPATTNPEHFRNRFAQQVLRLQGGHAWQYIVNARVAELRIQNSEAYSG